MLSRATSVDVLRSVPRLRLRLVRKISPVRALMNMSAVWSPVLTRISLAVWNSPSGFTWSQYAWSVCGILGLAPYLLHSDYPGKTMWVRISEIAIWSTLPEATRFPACQHRVPDTHSACSRSRESFAIWTATTEDLLLQIPRTRLLNGEWGYRQPSLHLKTHAYRNNSHWI